MTEPTHAELDRICEAICDNCHWPHELTSQEELDERCAGCRIPIDLANLVEKLESKQIAKPLATVSSYTRACPTCGALYGLSGNRMGEDTEYCSRCGQLTSGWMEKSVYKTRGTP